MPSEGFDREEMHLSRAESRCQDKSPIALEDTSYAHAVGTIQG